MYSADIVCLYPRADWIPNVDAHSSSLPTCCQLVTVFTMYSGSRRLHPDPGNGTLCLKTKILCLKMKILFFSTPELGLNCEKNSLIIVAFLVEERNLFDKLCSFCLSIWTDGLAGSQVRRLSSASQKRCHSADKQ